MNLQAHLVKPGELTSEKQFIETAKDDHSFFVAILNDGAVDAIGVLSKLVHPVRTDGYVNNIVVSPKGRGKGYARMIMDALEKKAKEWGCTRMDLTCSRPEVQAMYKKFGYTHKDTKFYVKYL